MDLLLGILRQDVDGIALALSRLGGNPTLNEDELRRDIQVVRSLREANALTQSLPRRLDVLLSKIERGDVHLNMSLSDFQQFVDKLDVVSNRLAFGLVVGASMIGSALLIQSGRAFTLPIFGFDIPAAQLSFLLSILLGAWMLPSPVKPPSCALDSIFARPTRFKLRRPSTQERKRFSLLSVRLSVTRPLSLPLFHPLLLILNIPIQPQAIPIHILA